MLKQWVEVHTEKTAWLVDVEFLLSNYECSWGKGCKGISSESPDLGCCANGAYLSDEDLELLERRVPELNADNWQNYGTHAESWLISETELVDGELVTEHKTAIVNPKNKVSGCVFANRPDFNGSSGCALHAEALKRGENPMDWKPEICWHMPLYVDYHEDENIRILRQFHWDKDAYDWFCQYDDTNWSSENPVYQTMSAELERLIGTVHGDPEAYAKIKQLLDTLLEANQNKPIKKRIPVTVVFG